MSPPWRLALLVTLVLPACTEKGVDTGATGSGATDTDASGTDTDTDASGTDAAPTTGTTGELPAGCGCAETDPCSVSLCETVEYADEGETDGLPDDPAFAAAVTCALEALRDGKAGRVGWTHVINFGQFNTHGRVEMYGDGTARRSYGGTEDLCATVPDQIEVGPLQPATFFEACLAETDLGDRFDCINAAVPTPTSVCQDGKYECNEF